jgi:DivIVA domain-containing protein
VTRPYGDLVEAITQVQFTPVRVREGYDMHQVDDLLDQVIAALGRGEPVTALLRAARFDHVRLREGYDIAEVDRFLEDLGAMADPDAPAVPAQRPASTGHDLPQQRGIVGRLLGRD